MWTQITRKPGKKRRPTIKQLINRVSGTLFFSYSEKRILLTVNALSAAEYGEMDGCSEGSGAGSDVDGCFVLLIATSGKGSRASSPI